MAPPLPTLSLAVIQQRRHLSLTCAVADQLAWRRFDGDTDCVEIEAALIELVCAMIGLVMNRVTVKCYGQAAPTSTQTEAPSS